MKECIKCKITKEISDFYNKCNQCKECKRDYQKKFVENKLIENSKLNFRICSHCSLEKETKFFNKYGSKCKECEKLIYNDNKEYHSDRKKKFNELNPGNRKEYWEKYYSDNKEDILLKSKNRDKEKRREYYLNNRDHCINKSKERYNIKIKNDDIFKLKYYIRGLIRNSFLRKNINKVDKTINILGCSVEDFKLYLESKFEDWMSWDNRGLYNGELNYGWDIDHIIPLSSAQTKEDIIRLNHYTNLQPLCSYTNRYIKRNNYL